MDPKDDGAAAEARPAGLTDLVALCRSLNREQARYIVIGGMAIIQAGFVRATVDIDLLVESSSENIERIHRALLDLPDQAIREMEPGDLDTYVVVRVADEIIVDLMKKACGVDFEEASEMIDMVSFDEVQIPFANTELLWRTKQTVREKDKRDREFLAARRSMEGLD
jgi:hypothetical protein